MLGLTRESNGTPFLSSTLGMIQMRELRFAPFVRLEVDCEMPQEVIQRLTVELGLSDKDDVYTICGPMALGGNLAGAQSHSAHDHFRSRVHLRVLSSFNVCS